MSAVYVGDMAFQETVGSVLNVDPWGMDNLTRKINGRSDQGIAYLNSLGPRRRNIRDSQFPSLYLTDYTISMEGAIWTADLRFRGIINSKTQVSPVFRSGYRVQQVTIPFIGDIAGQSNGVQASYEYIAPFTRVTYSTPTRPTRPLYKGFVQVTRDSFQILTQTGVRGTLSIFRGDSLNIGGGSSLNISGATNAYVAIAESYTTEFNYEPVGQWWAVEEVNEARLRPITLGDFDFT